MTTFRCRSVKPKEMLWQDVEADSPELAANDYHARYGEGWDHTVVDDRVEGKRHKIGFMRVEVEGHDSFVSRMYYYGIWRRGGVKPWGYKSFEQRLKEAAEVVGFERDPTELADDGWDGEEEERWMRTS